MTEHHDYNTPEPGTADWHQPLNENFDTLDTDVVVKGLHEDRPDDPGAGSWYLSTDRNWLSHYDGDGWTVVGGRGTDADPVPPAPTAEEPYTLDPDSVAEIDEAIAEHDHVRVRRGTDLVEESPSITIDPVTDDGSPRRVVLDMRGSRIEYTGTPDEPATVLEFPTSFRDGTGVGSRVTVLVDELRGPGNNHPVTGVRLTDHGGVRIEFDEIRGWGTGIHVHNEQHFSEQITIRGDTVGGKTAVKLTSGPDARASIQGLRMDARIDMWGGGDNYGIYMDGPISLEESVIRTKIFTHHDDDTAVRYDNFGGGKLYFNLDGRGDEQATGIEAHHAGDADELIVSHSGLGTPYDGTNHNRPLIHKRNEFGNGMIHWAGSHKVQTVGGLVKGHQRSRDPDAGGSIGELRPGEYAMYVSDGSDGVTGDAGDVVLAVNRDGTVKTTVVFDFSEG